MTQGKNVMDSRQAPALRPSPARRRQWWIAALALIVLLAGYAGALAWVTNRLEIDIQKSIHPAPAVLAADHADGV
jgi:ferric-dicitrate binding protein FerR (iron transport regulator)